MLSNSNFAAILPGDSVAGVVVTNGILNFLNIYNTLLVVRLVLTWFPNAPPAVVSPLSTLCDPYLNIFRGIIPPLGGTLDLSPILAFLVLNAFTSTAAALPAELPSTEVSKDSPSHATTAHTHEEVDEKQVKKFQCWNLSCFSSQFDFFQVPTQY
ncbi:UNVERIFIED_CONTAM: YlmGprotein 2, chloroplastic [Sesamum calycinum]|uniref:YlmGprotein 2, chloroplastic n=1 Tax=Sesamum calycinum TaxID=2727403 RepID=A0AAW2M111_9LAMI